MTLSEKQAYLLQSLKRGPLLPGLHLPIEDVTMALLHCVIGAIIAGHSFYLRQFCPPLLAVDRNEALQFFEPIQHNIYLHRR